MSGLNQSAIANEDRMSLWARRHRESVLMDRKAAEIARELDVDIPSRTELTAATAAGDAWKLRGIPAIGPRGAPSAIRGSSPHRDAPSLR